MTPDFASQADLVQELVSIFPEFEAEWASGCEDGEPLSSSPHAVYMTLLPMLGRVEPSERQIRKFADLVNGAVAAGGLAENAVSTCLLEHFRGASLFKKVRPYLSASAKQRLSAHFVPDDCGTHHRKENP